MVNRANLLMSMLYPCVMSAVAGISYYQERWVLAAVFTVALVVVLLLLAWIEEAADKKLRQYSDDLLAAYIDEIADKRSVGFSESDINAIGYAFEGPITMEDAVKFEDNLKHVRRDEDYQ